MFRCLIAKLLLCGCQSFIKESYLLTYPLMLLLKKETCEGSPYSITERTVPELIRFLAVSMQVT